jgi:hypothetical protein
MFENPTAAASAVRKMLQDKSLPVASLHLSTIFNSYVLKKLIKMRNLPDPLPHDVPSEPLTVQPLTKIVHLRPQGAACETGPLLMAL